MVQTRKTELDLCRIAACLGVVLIHANSDGFHIEPFDSWNFWVLDLLATGARFAVPIFFMVSGALLFSRETMDPWQTLRKRAGHVMALYLIWSLGYAVLRAVSGAFSDVHEFVYTVVAGHYHMWFLPAMALVYAFMPPAHAAIHGRKMDPRYLLCLFFFFGIFLTNCNLTPDPMPTLYRFTQIFSLDSLPYLGYAVWGWWLSEREMPRRMLWLAPLVFLVTLLVTTQANFWYTFYYWDADGWLFSYFSLPNFLMSSAAFCFFLALRGRSFRHAEAARTLADCTLGVYLLHPLLLNLLKQLGLVIRAGHVVGDTLLRYGLTVALTFPLAWLLRKIPGIRKLLS